MTIADLQREVDYTRLRLESARVNYRLRLEQHQHALCDLANAKRGITLGTPVLLTSDGESDEGIYEGHRFEKGKIREQVRLLKVDGKQRARATTVGPHDKLVLRDQA